MATANRGKTIFNSVKLKKPQRSTFNLSHDVKMSAQLGYLYPVMITEVIPGDSFKIGTDATVRFAPLLAPCMHRFNFFTHYFFVPHRISWDGWEDFIVNNAGSAGTMPYITMDNGVSNDTAKFLDYCGINVPNGANSFNLNALAFAAYQRTWNEYYRDQNLQAELDVDLVNGDNTGNIDALCTLRKRNLEHDYFTAALPFAQKGAAVDIPLGDVVLKPDILADYGGESQKLWRDNSAGNPMVPMADNDVISALGGSFADTTAARTALLDPNGTMTVQATTINDLRRAFRLQEWLERNALGGTRYIEHILAHFGVRSSDARLQRPEYITGVKMPIVISEVMNQTGLFDYYDSGGGEPIQTGTPQGYVTGHGIASQQGDRIGSYFAEEHGYVIGIMSVLPRTAYQEGIPKHFLKTDFLDYAFPEFANLGEQPLLNEEVYSDTVNKGGTFGYVPRYSEYKFCQSRVAGEFKTSLNYWHAARIFGITEPALNSNFIECDPQDYSRIFAVPSNTVDHLYIQIVHKVIANRLLPFYGTPTI